MIIVNAKDGPCTTYTTGNLWVDYLCTGDLFWLASKIIDAAAHVSLYMLTAHGEADPVLTTLPVKRCMDVN